jgi:hypothetical protein
MKYRNHERSEFPKGEITQPLDQIRNIVMIQLFDNKDLYYSFIQLLLNYSDDDEIPEDSNGPVGINEWSPEAHRSSPIFRRLPDLF